MICALVLMSEFYFSYHQGPALLTTPTAVDDGDDDDGDGFEQDAGDRIGRSYDRYHCESLIFTLVG